MDMGFGRNDLWGAVPSLRIADSLRFIRAHVD